MGTGGAGQKARMSARVRALGNTARLPSGQTKAETPDYAKGFQASLNRQLSRELRRRKRERGEIESRKADAIRDRNQQQAQDERARVRAEREAAMKRR